METCNMETRIAMAGLIPRSLGMFCFLFVVIAAGIAGLEFAYYKEALIIEKSKLADIGLTTIPALDVTAPQGILSWLISILLFATAVVAWSNYRLGRYHRDPFWRVNAWFWSCLLLFFLSMDVQVNVHDTIRQVCIHYSGTAIVKDGTVWWLGLYVALCGLIGVRLLSDLAKSASALGLFALALATITAGLVIEFATLPIPLEPTEIAMLRTGLKASSALLLFLSFAWWGREQLLREPEGNDPLFRRTGVDLTAEWQRKILPEKSETTANHSNVAERQVSSKTGVTLNKLNQEESTGNPMTQTPVSCKTAVRPTTDRPLLQKDDNESSDNMDHVLSFGWRDRGNEEKNMNFEHLDTA